MGTLRKSFEKMSTEELQKLLRDDYHGLLDLDTDTILLICTILAERHPPERNAEDAYRRFVNYYLCSE